MFDGIFDAIEEWMRELLTGVINTNLDRMFTDVNQKTGEIAGQVGMTRMIEIYLYTSVAPIPFATMSNREWGQIGTNYLKGLFALAFQAFLIMVGVMRE